MKIHKFVAKNYGPYEHLSIPIGSMRGVWLVEGVNHDRLGNNGTGKSSLYDPVFFGLTGQSIESLGGRRGSSKTLDDLVLEHPDLDKAGMEVEIFVDDKRIVRGHSPKRFKVYKVNADGSEENVTSTISQQALEDEWNISASTLAYMFRFGGGESGLSGYVTSGVEFGRKIQDALVQADRLTRCLEASRTMTNASAKERDALSRDVLAAQSRLEELRADLDDIVAKSTSWRKNREAEEEEAKSKLVEAEKVDLKWHEETRAKIEKAESEIDRNGASAKEAMARIKDKRDNKSFIVVEIEKIEAKKAEAEEGLADIFLNKLSDANREAYEAYEKAKELKTRLSVDLDRRRDLEERISEAEAILKPKRVKLDRLKDEAARPLPVLPESNEEHEKALVVLDGEIADGKAYVKQIQEDVESLGSPSSEVDALRGDIKAKNKLIESYKRAVDALDDEIEAVKAMKPGTTCPTCLGDISSEHVEHAVEAISGKKQAPLNEIKRVKDEIEEVEYKLESANSAVEELSKKKDLLAKTREKLAGSERKRESLVSEIEANLAVARAYEEALAAKEMAGKTLDAMSREVESEEASVERMRERLDKIDLKGVDPDEELRLAKKRSEKASVELEEARERRMSLIEKIALFKKDIAVRETEIKTMTDDIKTLRAKVVSLTDAIETSTKELEALREEGVMATEEIASARARRAGLKQRLSELKDSVDPYESMAKSRKASVEEAEKKAVELEKALAAIDEDLLPYLRFWTEAFGPNGIRPMVMREITPVLNQQVARWMSKLPGYQVGMRFDDQLVLDFHDLETGKPIRYSRMSSGMKMRVNIATAFALRDTICASTGCEIPVFVSDEGLESFDEVGMLGYYECLEEIGVDACVILINHHPKLHEVASKRAAGIIRVERRNGLSSASVDAA